MHSRPSMKTAEGQDELQRLRDRVAELEKRVLDQRREIEDLRSHAQRYRAVVDSVHAIVWESDLQTFQFTFVSDHAEQITGYSPEQWYAPDFWPNHIHPEDRARAVRFCRERTARGESHDFEYRMITADGRTIWLRDIVTVISEAGQPKMLRGVMIDITKQRTTEQQLRSHDQRLRLTADQMPAIMWSVDHELRFTSSLGAGLERLGLKVNAVVGKTLEEYFEDDSDVAEENIECHRRALARESVQYRTEWGGNTYEVRLEPLYDSDGNSIGVIGLAIDVTDRERAEQQLRESEHRWQSIFEFALDPLFEWDIVADRATWSPSWARFLGYEPEAFDPDRVTWESVLHPADRPQVLDLLDRYLRGDAPEYVIEYRVRTRDGHWRWVLSRGIVVARDAEGRPLRMIGCVVDMTDRRQLEDALRHRITSESLLATISSQFVNIASDKHDEAINEALKRLGDYAEADRAYVFLLSEDGSRFTNTHEWCADGIEPQKDSLQNLSAADFSWWMETLRELRPIYIPDVDTMPDEAAREKELLQSQSIRSLIVMPMQFMGELRGFIGYDRVRQGAHTGSPGTPGAGQADHDAASVRRWSEEDAAMLGAVGSVFINAIERQRVEETIRENERFLATLLSNLPGWVYRCRNERPWTYEFSSDGIEDVLGYPAETFMAGGQLAFNDLIHPDDRERVWNEAQQQIALDEPFRVVYRIRASDGSEKWVWEQGRAIRSDDGQIVCLEGFVSDITERKQAEDELRRQEREFHAIVQNTPDIISRFDCKLNHIYVNPVIERLTGHTPEALLDKHVSELPWPRTRRGQFRDAMQEVIRDCRETVVEFEFDGLGGRMFLECRLVPEFDDDGRIESILAISRNVTMRKRAELGLMRANETQRLLLRELDHRVRNNLASLAALIDITSRSASTIAEFAESIRGRVQAMTQVHALLSKGHWSSVSLSDLLESLIPADLHARFDLQGPDVLVGANQCTALGMVVQELIANSLKYGALQSAEGKVRIHWTSDEPEGVAVTVLYLRWSEHGGPPVTHVNKPGLGMNLIDGLVRTELRGRATMTYPPEGAAHDFQLELDNDDS